MTNTNRVVTIKRSSSMTFVDCQHGSSIIEDTLRFEMHAGRWTCVYFVAVAPPHE